MKNKPENVIMTEGDPKKIIFRFAQPLILANLFQQLYNTMDTIIVGKINGDEALAAVGVSFAVTMVMIAVATGTGIGTSVLIAKYCGAGNKSKVKTGISEYSAQDEHPWPAGLSSSVVQIEHLRC